MLHICYLYNIEHKHWDYFLSVFLLIEYLKTKEKFWQIENVFLSASTAGSYLPTLLPAELQQPVSGGFLLKE